MNSTIGRGTLSLTSGLLSRTEKLMGALIKRDRGTQCLQSVRVTACADESQERARAIVPLRVVESICDTL